MVPVVLHNAIIAYNSLAAANFFGFTTTPPLVLTTLPLVIALHICLCILYLLYLCSISAHILIHKRLRRRTPLYVVQTITAAGH